MVRGLPHVLDYFVLFHINSSRRYIEVKMGWISLKRVGLTQQCVTQPGQKKKEVYLLSIFLWGVAHLKVSTYFYKRVAHLKSFVHLLLGCLWQTSRKMGRLLLFFLFSVSVKVLPVSPLVSGVFMHGAFCAYCLRIERVVGNA